MTGIHYFYYVCFIFVSNIVAYSLGRSNRKQQKQIKEIYRQQCTWETNTMECMNREHGCTSRFCRSHCEILECNCGIYIKEIMPSEEEQQILEEIRKI